MTIKNIQGLRAIAALLVVCVHFGNPNGFEHHYLANPHPFTEAIARVGYLGVDLFFLISGFIMVITTFRPDGRRLSTLEFFKRRIIRIYPPLWIINTLVLVVFIVKPSLVNSHSGAPTSIVDSYLLLPQAGSPLVLVAWTLVYEMLFYVVFALGLLGGARTLVVTLAAWAAAIAVANVVDPNPHNMYAAFFQNTIVCEFLLGAVIALISRMKLADWWATASLLIGMVAISMVAVPIVLGRNEFPDGWMRVATAIPLACILLGTVLFEQRAGAWTPTYLQKLGDASYALYLWHIPTLTLVGLAIHASHVHGPIAQVGGLMITLAAVLAVAIAVYTYIESPVTEWLRVRFSKSPQT